MQKNKGKAPSLKNSTWARKIAEDFDTDAAIIDLLPKPAKAKKKELDLPTVHGGFKWEHEAASADAHYDEDEGHYDDADDDTHIAVAV